MVNTNIDEVAPQEPSKASREEIFAAALITARHTNLVPTFIGPTASGKTYGMHQLAEENDAEVVTVLLSQHTPDEITGFQLAINDKLVVQMPFWFTQAQEILDSGKSAWILFDELGLSREETRGALYTFMRDRELHGHRLHTHGNAEVLVFAASNPASFAPPFKTRCLFFNIPSDREYLKLIAQSSKFVSNIVNIAPINDESDPFYSNAEPPPPVVLNASATKALIDLTSLTAFWKLSEPARYAILSGLVPYQTLVTILKDNNNGTDLTSLARNPEQLDNALKILPKDQALSTIFNVLSCMPAITPEERVEAIISILDYVYSDLTGETFVDYFNYVAPEDVAAAINEIDAELLQTRLSDRGLLHIKSNSRGNVPSGRIVENLEKMIENGTTNSN